MSPKVLVVIPVFNARPYLRDAVESVLHQTLSDLSLLVVDDGSTDGSLDAIEGIRDSRLVVRCGPNRGKAAVLNEAIRSCVAEYFAVNDADDLSHPNRIEAQWRWLEANTDAAAVFCGHELLIGKQRCAPQFRGKTREQCAEDVRRFRMPAHDPTGMYRVQALAQTQFDERLTRAGEGLDLILRLGERWPLGVLPECLYTYRIHLESITRSDPAVRERQVDCVLMWACARRGLEYSSLFPERVARASRLATRWRRRDRDNNLAAHFIASVKDFCRSGDRYGAMRAAVQCLKYSGLSPHSMKAVFHAVAPLAISSRWGRV